ncbi:agmatine deiminase [Aestuariirhabdus sp. Z084]|uniref:agmatine deiminase n=1 Tax=Aestuariirhabdus haliotis TaxID=2918751 RepID=UPI00201B4383|nr:agmatine deiminase [Aestuariirhabdus haliotis]MCL6417540.1 agmatine deiminase [Aestuariirhabdus haliotis]MCL6421483.1 agmatine deiminase [Aestuariirhabdus haliotis]
MTTTFESTPREDGFRMPGEHEPHEEIWMAWPERCDNWRNGAKPAQEAFVNVAKAIAEVTPVNMAVSASQYDNARHQLPDHIRLVEMTTNDSWMRDIGPSYVVNGKGERRGVDWEFNAWGGLVDGLYFPWDRDDQIASKICEFHRDGRYRAPIILEGGSIHVDGEGTLYTTEECLLHESRNPDLTREELEEVLKAHLSVEKVVWIPRGLYNDETNGHVDNLIHVVKPGEVILSWTDDQDDPQYEISQEAYKALSEATDAKGRSIKIHKMYVPGPLFMKEEEASGIDACDGMEREAGERLAGSYANFLITNKRIILPLLDPAHDEQAKVLLQDVFPGYEVVGVDAREILLGGGNIHCITQQVPVV